VAPSAAFRRVAVRVPPDVVETARAVLAELSPAGWEERDLGGEVELAVYGVYDVIDRLAGLGWVTLEDVEPGWEDAWRAFHRPARVGRLWIGPPWESPPADAIPVVVDPGQAFGTGAHPTTRLCLELLSACEPSSIVDLGCGSGVLAIAAARLGFAPVTAVDCEPAAVEAAIANAAANDVEMTVVRADLLTDVAPHASLAVANLELALVCPVAERFGGRLLIASGYLERDGPRPRGWRRRERRVLDGWAAELFERVG
jgi:ribosomal protein L11 methyltransferase